MGTLGIILYIVLILITLSAAGIRPRRSIYSRFELSRRSKQGDKSVQIEQDREETYPEIVSLQIIFIALLLLGICLFGTQNFGTVVGVSLVALTSVFIGWLSGKWPFKKISKFIYKKIESHLIKFVKKYAKYLKYITFPKLIHDSARIGSAEDLSHLVDASGDALNENDKKLLIGALGFEGLLVKDFMVPKSEIVSIKKSEVLGPVVLNDLHNSGHSHFPVISRDIDHVVGVLGANKLLVISGDTRSSSSVETVMDKSVYTIDRAEKLSNALTIFVEEKCSMLIVQNKSGETVGILTLGDILRQLFGRALNEEPQDN